jgi:glycosyltransferase involved in cell wall biosynthesis
MFFSIIVPTHNRAQILRETLSTVLSQTYDDFEVIVVDDGSTDNTAEMVRDINNGKIRYFYKANEERSIARNFGADKASGEYLIFLDSDDHMKANYLRAVNAFLREQSNDFKTFVPEFVFTGYTILNTNKTVLYEYGLNGLFKQSKLFYGNFLGCSSVVVKKSLFEKYYFNTDRRLILFEDWELWLRIISDNKLYCFPGKSIVMMNHKNRSVLNYSAGEITERIVYFKNHILSTSELISKSIVHKRAFLMGVYSYAALHIAMAKKNRGIAIKYFLFAFMSSPAFIFKRRFFGVIKQLF